MAQATIASIQSLLDTTAQGRGVRITRVVRAATTASATAKNSIYVVPVVTSHGQAGWIDTNIACSACAQAAHIASAILSNGAAPRYPSS